MYYPESQIIKNIHSNGELVYKYTGLPYVGYYYKVSSGLMFDKEPNNPLTQELINPKTNNSSRVTDSINVYNYTQLINSHPESKNQIPQSSFTLPQEQDYKNTEFIRYFCKKANEISYIEIDKTTFDKLKNKNQDINYKLYIPFDLRWKIVGIKEEVYNINKQMVEYVIKNLKMYNFNLYLKEDYTKYLA